MEETKYQVFISSTYKDLIEERKQVLDTLLKADCIPAGMELFVATDDSQFNVIKKVIDMCDYYILILGKNYGSINPSTGISYTEMEYDYAKDKGIPVLVFTIADSATVDPAKCETDKDRIQKLKNFKDKAMKNRLASIWTSTDELVEMVAISIMKAIYNIKRPGWHRGDVSRIEQLEEEISDLKKENEQLKSEIMSANVSPQDKLNSTLILLESNIKLHYTENVFIYTSNTIVHTKIINESLKKLFKFISLRITGEQKASAFIDETSAFVPGYYVDTQDALILRNQFEQLKLLESFVRDDGIEMLRLTKLGKDIMNALNKINP